MALISPLGRSQRVTVLDPLLARQRSALAFRTVSPLYESIDAVAQSIVDKLKTLDGEHLPHLVGCLSVEVKTVLEAQWAELFLSKTDLDLALAESLRRVGIGIQSGLMLGGFKQCRVKNIALDPESQRFVIRLSWMKEPSRFKKLLTRRH